MNLNNLSVGMKLGSYKALCQTLDIPVRAGNSKVAQLKELERYVSYTRQGNSYIIQEVYDIPKQGSDGRQKYIHLLEPLLLHLLGTTPSLLDSGISSSRWYKELGLTTNRFYDKKERQLILEHYRISSHTMYLIGNLVSRKCRETLFSALSNMKHRGLIDYKEYWYIVSQTGLAYEGSEVHEHVLKKIRDRTLTEMGCSSIKQIFLSPKRQAEYDRLFHKGINDAHWRTAYKALRIEPLGDIWQKYTSIDPIPLKQELNKELIRAVKSSAYKHEESSWEKELDAWAKSSEDPSLDGTKTFSLPHGFGHNAALILDDLLTL